MTRSWTQILVDTVRLRHPTRPGGNVRESYSQLKLWLGTGLGRWYVALLMVRWQMEPSSAPRYGVEPRIRDPTTPPVLWVDGGQFAQRQLLGEEHDTSTRRMSLSPSPSQRGRLGEAAMLIHHRSNRASIDYSLTRQTGRPQ